MLMLPLGTSAVTLGLGFILALEPAASRPARLAAARSRWPTAGRFPVRCAQSATGAGHHPRALAHGRTMLGASPLTVWREVDLPIVARAVSVAAAFAFTVSMGEFGATSLARSPRVPQRCPSLSSVSFPSRARSTTAKRWPWPPCSCS